MTRVLPYRSHKQGTRPGVTGTGPLGPNMNDEAQWVLPKVKLLEIDKKRLMAEVMRFAVETMFTTHLGGGCTGRQRVAR